MFRDTYREARRSFLDLADAHASRARSLVLEGHVGIDGEELAMDVATFGPVDAPKALLVMSGTHGLEGPAGSAVQQAFIDRCGRSLPRDVKIVAIHALNPWGFSHGSRTDADNIDVNRNFVDFEAPLPHSPAYAELHAVECPDAWNDDTPARLMEAFVACAEREGLEYLMEGLTTGQFQEPTGLNYGGRAPSWSRQAFEQVVAEELHGVEAIGCVEWHTGLGRSGELVFACHHPAGSAELDRVAEWWGRDAVTALGAAYEGTGGVVPEIRGALLEALPALVPGTEVCGSVIELGTYENMTVLEGLMIDRWLRFGLENQSSSSREDLERRKREIFTPADRGWRAGVLEPSIAAQLEALRGIESR